MDSDRADVCTSCGKALTPEEKFCGFCGQAVAPRAAGPGGAATADPQPSLPPPPSLPPQPSQIAPPPDAPGQAADISTLLGGRASTLVSEFGRGDWPGALLATLGGLATMLLLALAGLLLLGAYSLGVGGLFRLAAQIVVLAVGGSTRLSGVAGGGSGDFIEVSGLPLTITLVGLGFMATVYLRRLGTSTRRQAVAQAVRMALILLVALLVLALAGSGNVGSATSSASHVSSNIPLTLLFALCWLAVTLAVALFAGRTAMLGDRAVGVREQVAGPLCGLLVIAALSLALGLPALLLYASWHGHPLYGLGAALLLLPNVAWTAVMLGVGVPVHIGGAGSISVFTHSVTSNITLTHLTSATPLAWLLPLLTLLCLLAGGLATALRAGDLSTARRDCLRLGLALPLVMLIGAWLMGLSGSAHAQVAVVGVAAQGAAHSSYLLALLLGAVAGVIAGGAGFLLAPRIPHAVALPLMRVALPLDLEGRARADRPPAPKVSPGASLALRLVAALAVVAMLLLVGAGLVDEHLKTGTYGPQAAVRSYLTAVQSGDATAALGHLVGHVTGPLLTHDALRAGGGVHNVKLGKATIGGSSAEVAASYEVGNRRVRALFQLVAERTHKHFGRYPRWLISNGVSGLRIDASGSLTSVAVNGVKVDIRGGSAVLPVFPGSYTVRAAASGPITAPPQSVIVTGAEGFAGVQLQAQLSAAGVSAVQSAVDQAIAACAASTVLQPPDCPFSDFAFGTATAVHWTVPPPGPATQVTLGFDGNIDFNGTGQATVHYIDNDGFSPARPVTDTPSYSYSGTATFSGDTPQIKFQ